MSILLLLGLLVLSTILLGYFLIKRKFTYWQRIGLNSLEPELHISIIRDNKAFLKVTEYYEKIKQRGDKHGGAYLFFEPVYIPVDLDLIKNIGTKDFEYFSSHGFAPNEEVDPLLGHLFGLEGEKWRKLRVKMTSSFTSGKMKMMFQTMLECLSGLNDLLRDHATIQDPVDIKEVITRFTTDVIGTVAFGLDFNTTKNSESKFRENGRKIFELTFCQKLKLLANFIIPQKLVRTIKLKQLDKEVEDFFLDVVSKTVKFREENNVYRKDFMHLMIQLKNRGKLADDGNLTKQNGEEIGPDSITFNELAAQCFVFFFAGFETSATTVTFTLLELATNQDIQEKLRKEIQSVLKKYNGEITYDGIKEMKYLNMVVYEALRKHPPVPSLTKKCTKQYQVPDTNVVIEKGTQVFIPIMGIQRDANNYPDPEKFDPERFTNENVVKRHPSAFLSFGEGPRYCIGARFALLQSKVAIISILNHFKLELHPRTHLPIKYVAYTFVLAVEGGVWLKVSKIQ